jgi:hypothetical protein
LLVGHAVETVAEHLKTQFCHIFSFPTAEFALASGLCFCFAALASVMFLWVKFRTRTDHHLASMNFLGL